jgi:hypothetical protein
MSCRKEPTTWHSDWVLPLVNDTLSLTDLENDSTLVVNSSFNYDIDLTRTILDLGLNDIIEVPDTSITQDYSIPVTSLTIPPGYNVVNEIEEHEMNIPDAQLKRIRVLNGQIKVKVLNPLETVANFTVQLPGVTKDGVEFSQSYAAPASSGGTDGQVNALLDISGYWIDLTGTTGGSYNILQSRLVVSTSVTGPSVQLTNQDVFKVQADFSGIKLDYARGYFGQRSFSDTTSVGISLLDGLESGSIDLPETSLKFIVENGMKMSAKATITTVKNTAANGNTVTLSSPQIGNPVYLNSATGSWNTLAPSSTTLIFDAANSNLENYLENLGNQHTAGFKMELNPWGNVSGGWDEIFPNSRLKVKLKAQLPLTIGMDDLTLRDTFDIDISQDREKTHVESGRFILNATNAFPFKARVFLYLLDVNGNLLHTIEADQSLASSLSGAFDTQLELYKAKSEIQVVLSESVLNDLDKIKKVLVRAKLDTPDSVGNNNPVSVPAGAFLSVKLKGSFKLKAVIQ